MNNKFNQNKRAEQENIIYIFIDASNLWEVQKAKGKFFDYEKLRNFIKEKFNSPIIKVFYYTAYPAEGTRDYSLDGRHKFYTFLKKGLGFMIRKKELKRISVVTKNGEGVEEKGNMDVEITIDALHNIEKYNIAVLFSGDSDFLALVSYLRRADKKVYIFLQKIISQKNYELVVMVILMFWRLKKTSGVANYIIG